MLRYGLPIIGSVALLAMAGTVAAQPIGQYRWQQQPYCNVITLNVVLSGGVYQLHGFDDQCGAAAPRAAVVGTAFLNPNGLVGMGLTVVTAPGATAVQINAILDPFSISGDWRDTSGNVGAFVFTPGAPVPGGPRPTPRSLFPAGLSLGNSTISNVAAPVASTDAANRGYVDGVAATKANTSDVSLVVPLVGAGSAAALPPVQLQLGATTFTSPRTAFLKIDLFVHGSLACATAETTRWWIALDGVPIRSSVRSVGEGTTGDFGITALVPLVLSGITPAAVAAGTHSVVAQGGCTSGSTGGSTASTLFNGSVTMLDAGYDTRDALPVGASVAVAEECVVQRAADGSERRVCG